MIDNDNLNLPPPFPPSSSSSPSSSLQNNNINININTIPSSSLPSTSFPSSSSSSSSSSSLLNSNININENDLFYCIESHSNDDPSLVSSLTDDHITIYEGNNSNKDIYLGDNIEHNQHHNHHHYQRNDIQNKNLKWLPEEPFLRCLEIIKFIGSTLLVLFSICIISYSVVMKYCVLHAHPALLFILLIGATILLAYTEALHYANVAVEKWDMTPYKERFPRACETQKLVKTNNLVQQFLVGRQFFVIFVVFFIAQITTFPYAPSDMWGMPSTFVLIFCQLGLPGIMWTLTFGQLIPQLYVEEFTLPLLNLHGTYIVTHICFAAEWIGICHFSWILFHTVSTVLFGFIVETAAISTSEFAVIAADDKVINLDREANRTGAIDMVGHTLELALTIKNLEENNAVLTSPAEAIRAERRAEFDEISLNSGNLGHSTEMSIWDLFRYAWSSFVTLGSFVVVVDGIWHHYSVLPVPVPALYIFFVMALCLLFYLEGLMICIVATQYWDPESFRETHPRAYKIHKVVNQPDVLKRFIVGRQFFTVLTNFLIAQIAVFPRWPGTGYNPALFFIVIRSGLVGVMITLAFAQLCPELLAARYPLFFMNMYGSYSVVILSLFIEAMGIGHCAWLTFYSTRTLAFGKYIHQTDLRPDLIEVKKSIIV